MSIHADSRPENFIHKLQTIASASSLETGECHFPEESFHVSGTETIDFVETAGRAPGNKINLVFEDAATLAHSSSGAPGEEGAPALYAPVFITDQNGDHGDHETVPGIVYTLHFDGSLFRVNVYTSAS